MTYSDLQLGVQMARNIAGLVALVALATALIKPSRKGSGKTVSQRAQRLAAAGALLAVAAIAQVSLKLLPARSASETPACALKGAEFVCEAMPALALPSLAGWDFSFNPKKSAVRALRHETPSDPAAALDLSSYSADASSSAEVLAKLAAHPMAGVVVTCSASRPVTVDKQIGAMMDCQFGPGQSRMIVIQRGPHFFTTLQCSSSSLSDCDKLTSGIRWLRPAESGAQALLYQDKNQE